MWSMTKWTDHIHGTQITHRQIRGERPASDGNKSRKRWSRKRWFNRWRKRRKDWLRFLL